MAIVEVNREWYEQVEEERTTLRTRIKELEAERDRLRDALEVE